LFSLTTDQLECSRQPSWEARQRAVAAYSAAIQLINEHALVTPKLAPLHGSVALTLADNREFETAWAHFSAELQVRGRTPDLLLLLLLLKNAQATPSVQPTQTQQIYSDRNEHLDKSLTSLSMARLLNDALAAQWSSSDAAALILDDEPVTINRVMFICLSARAFACAALHGVEINVSFNVCCQTLIFCLHCPACSSEGDKRKVWQHQVELEEFFASLCIANGFEAEAAKCSRNRATSEAALDGYISSDVCKKSSFFNFRLCQMPMTVVLFQANSDTDTDQGSNDGESDSQQTCSSESDFELTPSEAEEDAAAADRPAHSAKMIHHADVMRRNALGETKLHQAAISVGSLLLSSVPFFT
jgi:hypothetical protein